MRIDSKLHGNGVSCSFELTAQGVDLASYKEATRKVIEHHLNENCQYVPGTDVFRYFYLKERAMKGVNPFWSLPIYLRAEYVRFVGMVGERLDARAIDSVNDFFHALSIGKVIPIRQRCLLYVNREMSISFDPFMVKLYPVQVKEMLGVAK